MKAIVHQEEDRSKAFIFSLIFHLGLLALLIFYTFDVPEKAVEPPPVYVNIEWGGGGDDAAAGEPDRGMNSTPAPTGEPTDVAEEETPAEVPAKPEPKPVPPKAEPKPEAPKPTPTTEDPSVAALRRQQEEAKRREKEQQERAAAEQRERDRIARAEAEAKERQAQARRDKIKNSGLGTGGTGQGTGTGGRPGNQGIPGGTGNNPGGTSSGSGGGRDGGQGTGAGGSVGGGLAGRKVLSLAKAAYNSDKQGTVRVKVCVNSDGEVTSAEATQAGSTTTDGALRSAATAAARKCRFAALPGAETQCGYIEYNFRLK